MSDLNQSSGPEHYNRYQQLNVSESNNNQFNNRLIGTSNTRAFSVEQEPNIQYEERENYLIISSKDRDIVNYPSSSNFVIDIQEIYKNIKSIELIQTILPDQNGVQNEPFLLLNVKELKDDVLHSPNKAISDAFAILQISKPAVNGTFIQIDKRLHENTPFTFNTPIASLKRLTLSIRNSDGIVFDFGGIGETTKAYQTLFAFRITTLHSRRDNLNHRNLY